MITCLVVVAVEILHIAAPWVKEKLMGSITDDISDDNSDKPQPAAPRIGKLRLTNSHRLLLDVQMCRHKTNQSVRTTQEAMAYAAAVQAESAEVERQLAARRKLMAKEKSDQQARMKSEKATVASKIRDVRDFTTGYLELQRGKLQSQVSRLKSEISLRQDEYDGLKQSIEMNKSLAESYTRQNNELERQIRMKSAQQVKEKAAMNKEHKVLTTHINKLENQLSTMKTYRLEALKAAQINLETETIDLKKAADKFKRTAVPRRHLLVARRRYYGTLLTVFILAAVMLVFNIYLIRAAVKLDMLGQIISNII